MVLTKQRMIEVIIDEKPQYKDCYEIVNLNTLSDGELVGFIYTILFAIRNHKEFQEGFKAWFEKTDHHIFDEDMMVYRVRIFKTWNIVSKTGLLGYELEFCRGILGAEK